MTGIRLVRDLHRGALAGDAVGSSAISYRAGQFRAGEYEVDIGTAGACFTVYFVVCLFCVCVN